MVFEMLGKEFAGEPVTDERLELIVVADCVSAEAAVDTVLVASTAPDEGGLVLSRVAAAEFELSAIGLVDPAGDAVKVNGESVPVVLVGDCVVVD